MGDNKDWLTAFKENKNFAANPSSNPYHLYVAYVIDALIAKEIEKQKGFPGVLELITIGRKDPDNEKYFQTIDRLIGINPNNFNQRVQQLVDQEIVYSPVK